MGDVMYDDLIGIPFKLGARGPEAYDCYGLLEEMFKRRGISILDYKSPEAGPLISALITSECARIWQPCEQKKDAAVLIRVPHSLHVAYMVDPYRMIHCWEQSGGVVVESVETWKRRVIGFYEPAAR